MILIDTNIISEMMKSAPDRNVVRWFDQQNPTHLYLSTMTIAEIVYGICNLPSGQKRQLIEDTFFQSIHAAFKHRILNFDEEAAFAYGALMMKRQKIGKPMSVIDGQIASIAVVKQMIVATRNVPDFEDCGLRIVNPFE